MRARTCRRTSLRSKPRSAMPATQRVPGLIEQSVSSACTPHCVPVGLFTHHACTPHCVCWAFHTPRLHTTLAHQIVSVGLPLLSTDEPTAALQTSTRAPWLPCSKLHKAGTRTHTHEYTHPQQPEQDQQALTRTHTGTPTCSSLNEISRRSHAHTRVQPPAAA